MVRSLPRLPLALALAIIGCGADVRSDGGGLISGTEGGASSSDTTGRGSTTGVGTDDVDSSDSGLRLDLTMPDLVVDGGCRKVDFLFVIDSSNSMRHHQTNLAASFPGFIAAIEAALTEAHDYQIMVVDTDPDQTAICQQYCELGAPICEGYQCDSAPQLWGECDRAHGAGVRHPLGHHASNAECSFATDDRYLHATQPDLEGTFACAAQVGIGVNKEWVFLSLDAAVSPAINAAGGCNSGFLRDDALLVITIITDEPDVNSGGTVDQWRDAVIEAKGGDAEAIVVLGLITPDVENPTEFCQLQDEGYPIAAPDMHAFVDGFPRSLKGSVCEPDYSPFFADAVALIDTACDEFVPPG